MTIEDIHNELSDDSSEDTSDDTSDDTSEDADEKEADPRDEVGAAPVEETSEESFPASDPPSF